MLKIFVKYQCLQIKQLQTQALFSYFTECRESIAKDGKDHLTMNVTQNIALVLLTLRGEIKTVYQPRLIFALLFYSIYVYYVHN